MSQTYSQTMSHTTSHTMSVLPENPLLLLSETNSSKFRLANNRVHLTYSGHIDPQSYLDWINTLKPVDLYSIVQETGDSGYLHTHILLRFTSPVKTTKPSFFDYNGTHPNIKKVTTDKHWQHVATYHHKDAVPFTNIPIPTPPPTIVDKVWSATSKADALMTYCTKPGEANGIAAIFSAKPIDFGPEPTVVWHPWQQSLYDEISLPCTDTRKVIWYYDPIGNHGKTFFAKHMAMYHKAFITTKGSSRDVATALQGFMSAGQPPVVVLFCFARHKQKHQVYECIESIKDGLITAEKYRSETLFFNSPHVVIFSNYLPKVSTMSLDRWDIRVLRDNLAYPVPPSFVDSLDLNVDNTRAVFNYIDTPVLPVLQDTPIPIVPKTPHINPITAGFPRSPNIKPIAPVIYPPLHISAITPNRTAPVVIPITHLPK